MLNIIENVSLAPLTTLQVGGKARFFLEATQEAEIIESLRFARREELPLFVLGGGSNLVVSDKGFDGIVLKIALKGIEFKEETDSVLVKAKAGENWDSLVNLCVKQNLAGIECLSGIPGSVGATPVQNVGAYGQEVSETIISVRVLERESGDIFDLSNKDCEFTYRSSIFNTTGKDKFIVLSASFRLNPNGAPAIRYKDLQQIFSNKNPDLLQVREAVLNIRAAKSMVVSPDDPNSQSAGSFFKNPIVEYDLLVNIIKKSKALHLIEQNESVPNFPVRENVIKIPAAWLIEKAGFSKGYLFNSRVGLSSNHTLAIINRGGATAQDIVDLMTEIQQKVFSVFKIQLTPEPEFIGF